MGVGYNPRIVTDGLVLCLDAANPRSAPTTAIESAVVSSVTGSGPSYNVVYTTNVSAARVGDKVNVEKREAGAGTSSTVLSTYTYEITALDRSLNQLTLTYESDTGSLGDDSPADLPSGGGSSGSPEIAPHDIVSLWIDMKGGNNGTPTNGPTFSSDNGGSLVFDGTNDYTLLSSDINLGTQASINVWLQCSNDTVIAGGTSYTNGGYLLAASSNTFYMSANGSYGNFNYNISNTTNAWKNLSVSRNASSASLYVNGVFYSSISISSTNGIRCRAIGAYDNGTYPMNGQIGLMQIYNRALSAKEILQNYEATKGRYA